MAFWGWWNSEGAASVVEAINSRDFSSVVDVITDKVEAIHPDLAWELGPGSAAEHRITLSAGGVAELRPLTERWRRAAPGADSTWEFKSARERQQDPPTGELDLAGARVSVDSTLFSIEEREGAFRLDIAVFNPAFPGMTERQRMQFVFLLLDWLLGEDDVERWIGTIDAPAAPLAAGVAAGALVDQVGRLNDRGKDPQWAVLVSDEGSSQFPAVAMARCPIRWVDHPLLDQHNSITVDYSDRTPAGLPGAEALAELRRLEVELETDLGGFGLLVAHETSNGSRVLHVYSDSEDQNATEAIERWVGGQPAARLKSSTDNSWLDIRHLTH